MTPAAFLLGNALGFICAICVIDRLETARIERLSMLLSQARAQADRAQTEREALRTELAQLRASLGGASVTGDAKS